jgi:hypothetical protein
LVFARPARERTGGSAEGPQEKISAIYEAVLPRDNNKLELVAVLALCNDAEIRHRAALAGPWTQ